MAENTAALSEASKKKKAYLILKLTILVLLVVALPLYLYFFRHDVIASFENVDDLVEFITSGHMNGIGLCMLVQIIQVIISVIPANFTQFAAGYLYGPWLGLLVAALGTLLGEIFTFGLARYLGKDALFMILGEKFKKADEIMGSKKGFIVLCISFLLPGLPKDIFCYVGGVSTMKFKNFIFLTFAMRFISIVGSVWMGVFTDTEMYRALIVLGVIVVIIMILGIVFKNKLVDIIDKAYTKFRG